MSQDYIKINGARENNLKDINLKIPKKKITIFTGVSGSGKSSIVFDTIAQEAGRQVNETYSKFIQGFMPKYGHPDVDSIENLSYAIIVDQKRIGGNSRSTLGTITDIDPILRKLFSKIGKPSIGPSQYYSFNDHNGMCKSCEGIGRILTLDLKKAIDHDKSLNEGAILLPGFKVGNWQWKSYASTGFFDLDKKIKDYSKEEYDKLIYHKAEKIESTLIEGMNTTYLGLVERFIRQNIKSEFEKSEASQKKASQFMTEEICHECGGKRYNEDVLTSKINGYSIADMTALQVDALLEIIEKIDEASIKPLIDNLCARLKDLIHIGLDYVSLNRETSTLSGGECQRLKLAKELNKKGNIYIMDEPTTGLHMSDITSILTIINRLVDKGNTVIVIEHNTDVIRSADWIIDMGVDGGFRGGEILYEGPPMRLKTSEHSVTAKYI